MIDISLQNSILARIKSPLSKNWIERAKQIKEQHEVHITGAGLSSFMKRIDGIEDKDAYKVRLQFASEVTKGIYADGLIPIEKVFTNRNAYELLEFSTQSERKKQILSNYIKAAEISESMNILWKSVVNCDPNGLIMNEIVIDENESIIKPFYYSVYQRDINENKVNQIIDIVFDLDKSIIDILFEWNKNAENKIIYRYINSEIDILFTVDNEQGKDEMIFVIDEKGNPSILINPFGVVPAVVVSTLNDAKQPKNSNSYIYNSLPLADAYLFDYTLFRQYKVKVNLPIRWEYEGQCKTCKGLGKVFQDEYVNNVTTSKVYVCPSCNGDGLPHERHMTETRLIPITTSGEAIGLPPAGIVQPETTYTQLSYDLLNATKNDILNTIWGANSYTSEKRGAETAFAVAITQESKNIKLHEIAKNAEYVENKLINFIGRYLKNVGILPDFKGYVKRYSKNFILYTGSEALAAYNKAKTENATTTVLNNLYINYINATFENNIVEKDKQLKLFLCDPMPHLSNTEISETEKTSLNGIIKLNLEYFATRYEIEVKPIFETTIMELRLKFNEYAKEMYIQPQNLQV